MEEHELAFILESYSWKKTDTNLHLLQHVENDTYVVDQSNEKHVVRRYRQGRYSADEVRAELEWMDVLSDFINLPKVVRNTDNDLVSRFVSGRDEFLYAVFEFVDGNVIEHPGANDYYKLGHLMSKIHTAADKVLNQVTDTWQGWNRPKYDLRQAVEIPLRNLLDFDALSGDDKRRCTDIAQELRKRFETLRSFDSFIHADLHFGNILVTPEKWYCLDFDECGFGHRAIDIGVVRLNLKGKEKSDEYWTEFVNGYGIELSKEEISLGAAARIFYMAGKIPKRQDIEDLRNRPDERIGKYLGWVESEIS